MVVFSVLRRIVFVPYVSFLLCSNELVFWPVCQAVVSTAAVAISGSFLCNVRTVD